MIKATINSEYRGLDNLFLLLKESILMGDNLKKKITKSKIEKLRNYLIKIETHLKPWGDIW